MALVTVALTIPHEAPVVYRCPVGDRQKVRAGVWSAYRTGGMRKVERFLARWTDENGVTRYREV